MYVLTNEQLVKERELLSKVLPAILQANNWEYTQANGCQAMRKQHAGTECCYVLGTGILQIGEMPFRITHEEQYLLDELVKEAANKARLALLEVCLAG